MSNSSSISLKIGKISANSSEGCKEIKIGDIYEAMKHKRDLALGIIFKPACGIQFSNLEPYATSRLGSILLLRARVYGALFRRVYDHGEQRRA